MSRLEIIGKGIHRGDSAHDCTCTPPMLQRYRNQLSGPLLDRIDLQVDVPRVAHKDLADLLDGESSAVIRARVEKARAIQELRRLRTALHDAQKTKGTSIDKRITRHAGYQTSPKIHKRVEEIFGWAKTTRGLQKTHHQGLDRVECTFPLTVTAYNLVQMRNRIWGYDAEKGG